MNELQIFNNPKFGEIRTIEENGNILFCGVDVARALGYANPRDAIDRHCRWVVKRDVGVQTGVKADGTPATQTIKMKFIPEGDLYRITAASELSGAKEFESWIFDDVLPTLRSKGAYVINHCAKTPEKTGEVARYIAILGRYMEKQGSPAFEIVRMIEQVSVQHGIYLPDNVVKPNPFQTALYSAQQ